MNGLLPEKVEQKLKTLPSDPGVYLMKDAEGQIIYVGKARVLKNRVRQYFGTQNGKAPKVSAMVRNVADLEYVITSSELEALILECNLIKQHHPYYNVLMRDDKHYPYVRIDLKDPFPRVEIVRKVKNDGAKYFGPYLAAHLVKEVLDAVYKLFPLRSCKKDIEKSRQKKERPCLNYQMGRCLGPCAGKVSQAEYAAVVKEVCDLLSGKYGKLEQAMKQEMMEASGQLNFERAAYLRDRIRLLKRISEKQEAGFPDLNDKDIFALAMGGDTAIIQAFFVRKGKLALTERYHLSAGEAQEAEVFESFLKQYYASTPNIPKNIFVSEELGDTELLELWLTKLRGSKVEIVTPKRGSNKKLVDMAKNNAAAAVKRREDSVKREYDRTLGACDMLSRALGLGIKLHRIECFDISNTQGTDSVASMVVFTDGKPDKKEYRRFKIKTVEGPDDFASMAEVLRRRIIRGLESTEKDRSFGAMPDLLIVDGGKGQLSSAVEVLESLGMEDMAIAGLAKKQEELFLPRRSEPVVLDHTNAALRLVTALRDEAHRFAITYHRELREKRVIDSELDHIKGVGQKRKTELIGAFGSVEAIRQAGVDELADVKGVDITTARQIYKYFHQS